jgi:uncharacterized protein
MTSTAPHPHTQRPMRRKAREIVDPIEINRILAGQNLMHLAMSQNNVPFLVPVFYAWDGKALYFHSAPSGSKIDILHENPEVCFEVSAVRGIIPADEACDYEAQHQTVIGFGRVCFVDDEADKIKALDSIVSRFTDQHFDYPKDKVAQTTVVRIDVHGMKCKQHGF